MQRKYFILFILIAFSACSERVIESEKVDSADDYLIYEKILEKQYSNQKALIVLDDSTQGESNVYANKEQFITGLSGLNTETLENYLSINREKLKLENISNINFVFASKYEYSSDPKIYARVSRVGYNEKKTQAVVTTSMTNGPFVGYGTIIFLVKNGSEWVIQNTMIVWAK